MTGGRRLDLEPEGSARPQRPGEPADACPFARPFPDDFATCRAFDPVDFSTLDLRHQPTPPLLTCANLVVGTIRDGAHYGRCTLGGPDLVGGFGGEPPLAG